MGKSENVGNRKVCKAMCLHSSHWQCFLRLFGNRHTCIAGIPQESEKQSRDSQKEILAGKLRFPTNPFREMVFPGEKLKDFLAGEVCSFVGFWACQVLSQAPHPCPNLSVFHKGECHQRTVPCHRLFDNGGTDLANPRLDTRKSSGSLCNSSPSIG